MSASKSRAFIKAGADNNITESLNVEGLTAAKQEMITGLCKETHSDILCIQATHRGEKERPCVEGMINVIEQPHEKCGRFIFVKNTTIVDNAWTLIIITEQLSIEL